MDWLNIKQAEEQRRHLLDVNALFGGGLEEGEAELFGELAAARRADDALVLEIALVADQNHLRAAQTRDARRPRVGCRTRSMRIRG